MATRIKGYLSSINRFYTWQTFDMIAFGYVIMGKRIFPKMSITKALQMFLDDFGLCEEEYCLDNARQSYYRILNSLKDKNLKGPQELIEDDLDELDITWKQKTKTPK